MLHIKSLLILEGWMTEMVRIILPKSGLVWIIVDTLSFSGRQVTGVSSPLSLSLLIIESSAIICTTSFLLKRGGYAE